MNDKLKRYLSELKDVPLEKKDLQRNIDYYVSGITPYMNKLHSTKKSERFWRILLGSYIAGKIRHGNKFCNRKETNKGITLNINRVYSDIIYFLRENRDVIKNIHEYKSLTSILQHENIIIGNRASLMAQDINGIKAENRYPTRFFMKADKDKRKRIYELCSELQDSKLKSFLKEIPEMYVEYYSCFTKTFKLIRPKNKVFHCEQGVSRFWMFVIAHYVEEGAKLYYYQPGGWMGDVEYNNGYLGQRTIADKFITYGWKLHEKDQPGKAYRLLNFKSEYLTHIRTKSNENAQHRALIVLTNISSVRKKHYETSLNKINLIVDDLPFRKIIIRYRPASRLLRISKNNELDIDINKNLFLFSNGFESMSKTLTDVKLVIHLDHPSTNFLECVAINKPVIAVLTNSEPTDIILKHYDFFISIGVLHLDVESMLTFLEGLDDVETWWQNVINSKQYDEFKKEFANIR